MANVFPLLQESQLFEPGAPGEDFAEMPVCDAEAFCQVLEFPAAANDLSFEVVARLSRHIGTPS